MVDAADQEKIEASKNELHNLLDKPQLQGIPVSAPQPPTPVWGAGPGGGASTQRRGSSCSTLDLVSVPLLCRS